MVKNEDEIPGSSCCSLESDNPGPEAKGPKARPAREILGHKKKVICKI